MPATLSILGLYNFDDSIFDNFALPTDLVQDKDTLINNLIMECAEFEVLYTDPDFIKAAIGTWSNKMLPIWEKQYATTQFNYDPISNYDRNETWTDTDSRIIENNRTPNLTNTFSNGRVITDKQNSFENAGFVDATQTETSGNDVSTTIGTDNNVEMHSGNVVRTGHAYGNIGVTTSQEMIEQEREIVKYNMFDIIIDNFQERFCLMIY